MPKRRQIRPTAFTHCTTRSTGKMCFCGPGAAAEPMAGVVGSMDKALRGSKRREWKSGWINWRKNWRKRLTGRKQFGGYLFLNQTASKGRWEYRPSKPKRRQIRPTAFTHCTTRSTGKMCFCGPGAAAEPMAGVVGSMDKALRGSKRREWKSGWINWRKNWRKRLTGRKQFGGYLFLNQTASKGRWEYRPSKIEWHRWQLSSYWKRSLKRI